MGIFETRDSEEPFDRFWRESTERQDARREKAIKDMMERLAAEQVEVVEVEEVEVAAVSPELLEEIDRVMQGGDVPDRITGGFRPETDIDTKLI